MFGRIDPCAPWRRLTPCLSSEGGDSSSSNATTTTTTNTDRRQVVDTGSVGVSSDSSTVNVTTSDHGSIAQSFDLARTTSAGAYQSMTQALAFGRDVLKLAEKNVEFSVKNADQVGSAYQVAQDSAQGLRFVVAAGLVVAGVVFVAKKRG